MCVCVFVCVGGHFTWLVATRSGCVNTVQVTAWWQPGVVSEPRYRKNSRVFHGSSCSSRGGRVTALESPPVVMFRRAASRLRSAVPSQSPTCRTYRAAVTVSARQHLQDLFASTRDPPEYSAEHARSGEGRPSGKLNKTLQEERDVQKLVFIFARGTFCNGQDLVDSKKMF